MRGFSASARAFLSVALSVLLVSQPLLAFAETVSSATSSTSAPASSTPTLDVAAASTATPAAASPSADVPRGKVVKELVDKRTACARYYLLDNDRVRGEYHAAPINYLDPASHRYLPIESSLVETSTGGAKVLKNKANAFSINLPDRLSDGWVSLETTRGRIAMRPDLKVRADAVAAVPNATQRRSDSATEASYPEAYAGADLRYESRDSGIKETIVVSRPTSATVFGFELQLTGLTPRLRADGSIGLFAEGETTPTINIPAPSMIDSSGRPDGEDFSAAAHYELDGSGSSWHLDVVVDERWMSDAARVYPVMIDPSVVYTMLPNDDTFVSSKYPTTNYKNHPWVWIKDGSAPTSWWEWAYVRPAAAVPNDLKIMLDQRYRVVDSFLWMYFDASQLYGYGRIYCNTCSGVPEPPDVTWANQFLGNWSYGSIGEPLAVSHSGWAALDVTNAMAGWQSGATTYQKMSLRVAGDSGLHAAFVPGDKAACTPYWIVDYMPEPIVTITSPASWQSLTSRPRVTWTFDGRGYPQTGATVNVVNKATGGTVASMEVVGSATSVDLPLPLEGLASGTDYDIKVTARTTGTVQVPVLEGSAKIAVTLPVRTVSSSMSFSPSYASNIVSGFPVVNDQTARWTNSDNFSGAQTGYTLTIARASALASTNVAAEPGVTTPYGQLPIPVGGWVRGERYVASVATSLTNSFGETKDTASSSGAALVWGGAVPGTRLSVPSDLTSAFPSPWAAWDYSQADGVGQSRYEVAVDLAAVDRNADPGALAVARVQASGAATSAVLPVPQGGWQTGQPYWVSVRTAAAGNGLPDQWSAWSAPRKFTYLPPSRIRAAAASLGGWLDTAMTGGINDSGQVGRGVASLNWDRVSGALGYNVYLSNGYRYNKVGQTSDATWSSLGAALYPSDRELSRLSTQPSSTPLSSPTDFSAEDAVALPVLNQDNSGVCLSDGQFLYVRGWLNGADSWEKYGTGRYGSVAGLRYGMVGAHTPGARTLCGIMIDDVLYSGYATAANQIAGVSKTADASAGYTNTITFSRPLLDRCNGGDLTGPSLQTMLAYDHVNQRIYSLTYRPGGSMNGFGIREFKKDGTFIADHTVGGVSSFDTAGLLSDGDALYIVENSSTSSARVLQVPVAGKRGEWSVTKSWYLGGSGHITGGGCYDPTSKKFWVGTSDAGLARSFSGPGLDQASASIFAPSPSPASRKSLTSLAGNTNLGICATDGTYAYLRSWGGSPVNHWEKYGTGLNGTVAGQDYGQVGVDTGGSTPLCGILIDDVLFSGYATAATQIVGVSKIAGPTGAYTSTITFDRPLLDRCNGGDLTGPSLQTMLAYDKTNQRIYSLTFRPGGSMNGFGIREFKKDGTFLADHTVVGVTSFDTAGLMADGDALYIVQNANTDAASVLKVPVTGRLGEWSVVNRWTLDQRTNGATGGDFDPVSKRFWMGGYYASTLASYAGPGLDLKDDPRGAYALTSGNDMDGVAAYRFKVVPFNASGEMFSEAQTVTVSLDNRTVSSGDDPRHTEIDLGTIAGSGGSARLDAGALTLSTSDVSIGCYGPLAALTRSYSSEASSASPLGPGWRFSFEESISTEATGATFTDARGQRHRFPLSGGRYAAPNGMRATLTTGTAGVFDLSYRDGTVLHFTSAGALQSETDARGNHVDYTTSGDTTTIRAADASRLITFVRTDATHAYATYSVGAVTRRVDYAYTGTSGDGTGTATYTYTGAAAPTPGYKVTYAYSGGRIVKAAIEQDAPIANAGGSCAEWRFVYASLGTSLAAMVAPPFDSSAIPATTTISYSTDAGGLACADVARSAEVSGSPATVTETHAWNRTGTEAYSIAPRASGDAPARTDYQYSPENDLVAQVGPGTASTRYVLDGDGDVVESRDDAGRLTTNAYDAYGNLTSSVDPRGALTTHGFASEADRAKRLVGYIERTLNEVDASRTDYAYDSVGRVTSEKKQLWAETSLGKSHWLVTESTYGAPTTSPTRVTQAASIQDGPSWIAENIDLGDGRSVASISSSTSFDGFGDAQTQTDASGTVVATNVRDAAGRLVSTTDATGVTANHAFDGMGREVCTWSTAQGTSQVIGYRTSSIDAYGRVASEKAYRTTDSTGSAQADRETTHVFDAMGRETKTLDSLASGQPARSTFDARGNTLCAWPAGLSAAQGADTAYATRSAYDIQGRRVSESAPGTNTAATTTEYNSDGTVLRNINPDGTSSFTNYSAAGDKVTETKSDGSIVCYAYDKAGRTVAQIDGGGLMIVTTYDRADRTSASQASGKNASGTTYNALSWVVVARDSDSVATTSTFDVCGRKVAQRTGTAPASSTRYDPMGRVLASVAADGAKTDNTLDPFGRVMRESQVTSRGVSIKDLSINLDSLSRATDTTSTLVGGSALVHHYTYPTTPGGRTLDAVMHAGITTTAYMDGAGYETSRDSTIAATGATLSRSVSSTDAAGRVTGWRIASQDASTASARTFDGAGRRITSNDPAWTATAEMAYDAAARESRRTLPYPSSLGGTRSSDMTYTVDGRLRQVTGSGAASYSYDASGNVCSFSRAAYDPRTFNLAYDSAGRLASLTASGTSTANTVYTFDTANGRRIAQGPPTNRTQVVFGYSDNGRLSSYDTSAEVHAVYSFDATGQRTRSVVTSGNLTTTTTFAYEGLALLSACSTDSAGATWTIAYLYDAEGRPYAGVETAENTSTIFRIVTDERGDVVALTDTTGDPFARYDYDEYGNPLSTLTRASARIAETTAVRIAARQMLRYAGYTFDSESGMYYCSARTYDPFTMQFLQKDPAKADGESSAYQYCGGDPVGKVDPSGMWAWMVFNGAELYMAFTFDYQRYPALTAPASRRWSMWGGPTPPGIYRLYATSVKWATGRMGTWKIRLYPQPGTNVYGRYDMFLHTGPWGTTNGCVRTTEAGMQRVLSILGVGWGRQPWVDMRVLYPKEAPYHE